MSHVDCPLSTTLTMASFLSSSIVVALLAWIIYPIFTSFPPPYTAYKPSLIDDTSKERFPVFPPDLSGVYKPNELLTIHATKLFEGKVDGTESVAVAPDGTLLMLDKYGYILKAKFDDNDQNYKLLEEHPPMYIGPGRPLGFHVVSDGLGLLVCDSLKGLIKVDLSSGEITVLANHVAHDKSPIHYTNDLDVASDGTVYFSSSTENVVIWKDGFYDTMRSYLLNMVSGDRTGRLLAYHPQTKETTLILDNIWYANGVTLAHDEQSILVVETTGFRVVRHWLKGPQQGQSETWIEKLPGFPDGITKSADGKNYWLSLVSPLSPLLKILSWPDSFRYALSHLLVKESITKRVVKRWGCILKVSPEGNVLATLMDPKGERLFTISAVTEHNGQLFLGNLKEDFVSVVSLKDAGLYSR